MKSQQKENSSPSAGTAASKPPPPAGPALPDPEFLPALGAAVRAARGGRGLSRKALAEEAGLSVRFVAQLEGGRGNISVGRLSLIARALGVPLALLLPEPPAEPPPDGAGNPSTELGEEAGWLGLCSEILALLKNETPERLRALLAQLRERRPQAPGSPPWPPVALVGLRGAGKSTIGPLLAKALGLPFVELDDTIQHLTGLALKEIFELHGERYYRLAEARALRELVDSQKPAVVAVSGGIVTNPHSLSLLRERTLLVWLKAPPALYMERVRGQGDGRPMRHRPNAMAELRQLLKSRGRLYSQARLTVDTSLAAPHATAASLAREIERVHAQDLPPSPATPAVRPAAPAVRPAGLDFRKGKP